LKRKFWKYYAGLAILSVLVALAVIFHDEWVCADLQSESRC
jgi:hypothetical protein